MTQASSPGVPGDTDSRGSCPSCGRPIIGAGVRCRFCLAELRDADTSAAPTREHDEPEPGRGFRLPQIRHRWSRKRGVAVVVLVLVLAWFVRWGYDTWIATDSPLRLPASTAVTLEVSSAGWPAINGDAGATRTTEASVALDGTVAWQTALPELPRRDPVTDGERIYITGRDVLYALNLDDGSEAWRLELIGLASSPSIANGLVFLALRSGDVAAFNAVSGEQRWRSRVGLEFFTVPIPYEGTLYVYGPGRIYGVEAETGELLWDKGVESNWAEIPPLIFPDGFVVAARNGVLIHDAETGKRTFRHPHRGTVGVALGEERFYSASPGFAAAVDLDSGEPWWEGMRATWNFLWTLGVAPDPPRPEVGWVSRERPTELRGGAAEDRVFAPIFDGEQFLLVDEPGLVRSFAADTGALRWETSFDSAHGPPIRTAEGVVIPLRDAIVLLDPDDGSELARREMESLQLRDPRWVVVIDRGTYIVDGLTGVTALTPVVATAGAPGNRVIPLMPRLHAFRTIEEYGHAARRPATGAVGSCDRSLKDSARGRPW